MLVVYEQYQNYNSETVDGIKIWLGADLGLDPP